MIYLKHPEHGAHHVYSEGEAVEAEKQGWVRAPWPPEAPGKAEKTATEAETAAAPRNKGGRPKKAA